MEHPAKHLNERVPVYAIIWCISYIGSLLALKKLGLATEAGIVLTIVTVLSFVVFVYKFYRSIYFMDEVQIKIQMEAVVIAFSFVLVTSMALGLIELVLPLNKEDWNFRLLVPLFVSFYFFGLFISKRKYHFDNEKHD